MTVLKAPGWVALILFIVGGIILATSGYFYWKVKQIVANPSSAFQDIADDKDFLEKVNSYGDAVISKYKLMVFAQVGSTIAGGVGVVSAAALLTGVCLGWWWR